MFRRNLFFIILVLLASCSERGSDRLSDIYRSIDQNPDSALTLLSTVDASGLSSADRAFFNLLTVKATDKAYILHTSDSLIKEVLDHYENHPGKLLPEVYYYGGRVYHDLGDAPLALEYYQQSLDLVSDDDLNLKGCVVSNMAQLMSKVYLYDQAIEKFKEAAEIDRKLGQTYNLYYDTEQIADMFVNKFQDDSALFYYNEALKISKQLSPTEQTTARLYIINTERNAQDHKNIRNFIHPIISDSGNVNRDMAMAIGAWIYREAGIIDSSLYCANELSLSNNPNIRLRGYSSKATTLGADYKDSKKLYKALSDYSNLLDTVYAVKSSEATIYQNSYYNYSIRERENLKLTEEKHRRDALIYCLVFAFICSSLLLLHFYNLGKQQKLKLSLALSRLERLEKLDSEIEAVPGSADNLKAQLVDKICRRIEAADKQGDSSLPIVLLESPIYGEFQKFARTDSVLIVDEHWKNFTDLFEKLFPEFRTNLTIVLGNFSEQDYRICILTKCGFSPTQIAKLTFKTKGGISSGRIRMSERAFGQKSSVVYWDKFVRSL